ncbi:MAG TPA: tRNA epoxyqueuosine(34) reductase QueG [Pyrinomonadaceae bacterium]|nr:tRNA epoxyqueuosine(34) reductase QueG [Pyrinomonadaceae bacterium]
MDKQSIKERALAEGFHKVGIVSAEPLDEEAPRLKEWLARGYHGEMSWMARDVEKRLNPRELFPQARSIVVVALNYYTPDQYEENSNTGKVSRYAWGDDYHDVLKLKLESLLAWIREREPAAAGKICVDIQPTLDKAWAVRAGLGWLGKHTNVITQEFGSWVFIGELLLNLELEPDVAVVEDHCGTCTLCIDACPTHAIAEPYVVDSNKCISYATIELRTPELPELVQQGLSGWLYGCDICQDVCPWNRFEETTNETRFEPRAGNVNAELDQIMELTPETYAARFRGSAMKRAKIAGLKRNARALSSDRHGPSV